jgi:hypothetical protein
MRSVFNRRGEEQRMTRKRLYMSMVGAGVAGLLAVAMVASVSAAPSGLRANPHNVNCGSQPVLAAKDCGPLILTNTTSDPITITNIIYVSGSSTEFPVLGFAPTCTIGVPVEPEASCGLFVRFVPQQSGRRTARLLVTTTDAGDTTIRLAGRGTD